MDKPNTILLSTAYLPPIAFFALLQGSGKSIIEQHETYQKQTYRNRCEIYSEKGKMALSVPVSKPFGNHSKTKDILIVNNDKWYKKHWRAIESAYSAAPFFLYYSDEIRPFFEKPFDNLLEYNTKLTDLFCQILEIKVTLGFSKEYLKTPIRAVDYRNALSPKKPQSIIHRFPEYTQVFNTSHGFIPNLSIIDLLFNLGPESSDYLIGLTDQISN